jgi:hypothetical protein
MSLGSIGKPPKAGYATLTPLLEQLLTDLGHDTETSTVNVGENLDEFDLIVVGLTSLFSIAGWYMYSIFGLLDRYWITGRRPVLIYPCDWESSISQNTGSACRVLGRLTRPAVSARRPDYSWAISQDGQAALSRVIHRADETGWPPCIIPAFAWGEHSVLTRRITAERHHILDVTSYTPPHPFTPVPPEDRERRWVLATVKKNFDGWPSVLGLGWPVLWHGGGGRQTTGLPQKRVQVHESQIIQEYAASWGVACPPYVRLCPGGLWRTRVIHAAMTRTPLLADRREMPQLGEPYAVPADKIEAMSNQELAELAEAQAAVLRAHVWPGERLQAEAQAMLRAAVTAR